VRVVLETDHVVVHAHCVRDCTAGLLHIRIVAVAFTQILERDAVRGEDEAAAIVERLTALLEDAADAVRPQRRVRGMTMPAADLETRRLPAGLLHRVR